MARNIVIVLFRNEKPSVDPTNPRNQAEDADTHANRGETVTFVNTRPATATIVFNGLCPLEGFLNTIGPNSSSAKFKVDTHAPNGDYGYCVTFDVVGEKPICGRSIKHVPSKKKKKTGTAKDVDGPIIDVAGDDPRIIIP